MIAMENVGKIVACYIIVLGGSAGYALWMLRRGRRLSDEVPDEEKSWT
jgi:hypothetical protein